MMLINRFLQFLTFLIPFSSVYGGKPRQDLMTDFDEDDKSCLEPVDKGNCDDKITRYYYNDNNKKCYSFDFTGCGGNDNRFETTEACEETCIKSRDTRRTPTNVNFKVLSDFDWTPPQGGYGNIKRKFPLEFCELQKDTGVICEGFRRGFYLEQFYYDLSTNQCLQFIYNGCGGNANRFSSLWECIQSCARKNLNSIHIH